MTVPTPQSVNERAQRLGLSRKEVEATANLPADEAAQVLGISPQDLDKSELEFPQPQKKRRSRKATEK